jgi:hypothetical protein
MKGNARKINFCQWCGGTTKHEVPDGEEKIRAICTVCEKIAYENPKMVCCSIRVCFAMETSLSCASANPRISYPLFVYFKIGFAQLGV